jgi:hypothetical protein
VRSRVSKSSKKYNVLKIDHSRFVEQNRPSDKVELAGGEELSDPRMGEKRMGEK